MYDIFTNPVVGYLRPVFFCVNFMVPGPMTGFIHLGDAVGGNWAENELFQQIKTLQKTLQSLTTKSVERGGKHHLVEESPRINRIFSETTHVLFVGIMESWYRLSITFWNGIIDGWKISWRPNRSLYLDLWTGTNHLSRSVGEPVWGAEKAFPATRSWKVEGEAQ